MMEDWSGRGARAPATVPVIMILGEHDRMARSERALMIAPTVEERVIEDAGHFPLWQQREQFVGELSQVLAKYAR